MKKFLSLILFFSLMFIITSCTQDKTKDALVTQTITQTEFISDNINNSNGISSSNDIGGGTYTVSKYRSIYCDIPRPFANLVDLYEFEEWYDVVIENDPNKTEIMPMKLFVQKFNISREDFDRANLEWTKIIINGFDGVPMMNPQDFLNQETDEVYNADIIYTFDDNLINNYYLSHEYPFVYVTDYENAVADGTYQTRTTDWVDVEQMEAEIIAKYGEAEIVTDVAEQTTSETAGEITSAADTAIPEAQITPETDVRITE